MPRQKLILTGRFAGPEDIEAQVALEAGHETRHVSSLTSERQLTLNPFSVRPLGPESAISGDDWSARSFRDKSLACADCGSDFVFSANEQAFYAEHGFTSEPKRCKNCRDKRKAARDRDAITPAKSLEQAESDAEFRLSLQRKKQLRSEIDQ